MCVCSQLVSVRSMFPGRAMYYALLALALCDLGPALRQGSQLRGDTEPSMRDVREVAKAAEAAGVLCAFSC